MYNKFFTFKERPFKLVPNPEYYYLSRSHEEAMAHLTYAISQGDGFVEITGEVGTGKTILCRVFLENLDDKTEVAYIFNPKLGPKQLVRAIIDEFGIACRADDTKGLIDALNDYLIRMKARGRKVLVLIDEAQNLEKNVLEQLRLLSNLETSRSKLLQIILVGQPELADLLDSHELRQLGQRITLNCHLCPLTYLEIREYIEHRIQIASSKPSALFTRGAYRLIYKYSAGIPRIINIVCDRSLLIAFSRNRNKITGKVVADAIRELSGGRGLKRAGLKAVKGPALSIATVCLAVMVGLFFRSAPLGPVDIFNQLRTGLAGSAPVESFGMKASVGALKAPQAHPSHAAEAATDRSQSLGQFIRDMEPLSARNLSLASVLEQWGVEASIDPALDAIEDDYDFFRRAAASKGFSVIRIRCDFELIRKLNLPTVLVVNVPGGESPGFLTLQKFEGGKIVLARAGRQQSIAVTPDTASPFCSGSAYIPWKDYIDIQGAVPRSIAHDSVVVLKMYLQDAGFRELDLSPYFDEDTERAVKSVQRRHGLLVDGIAGPLTRIVLYNDNKDLPIPLIQRQ